MCLQVTYQFGLVDLGAGFADDEGLRSFSPFLVRNPDDHYLEHGGMRLEGVLDLDSRDVLSAGDDDVLGAITQFDVAVRVLHAQVPGVQPAAAERLFGGYSVVEVPDHHIV